jgi:3-hydroxyethyl bacteriochlorophyllide a dehydrogenase
MGYPLVPGYESVGRVVAGRPGRARRRRARVRARRRCFGEVRGLFGGARRALVVPGREGRADRRTKLGERGVLLALAATAYHAIAAAARAIPPDLIVGHGVLGRLLARLTVLAGPAPVVWETNAGERRGRRGLRGDGPRTTDTRRDYRCIYDVSGDASPARHADRPPGPRGRDRAGRLLRRAAVIRVPAGLHARGPHPRRRRVAAQPTWSPCANWPRSGALSLDGLITHRARQRGRRAYRTAFGDPTCLKMILDWRGLLMSTSHPRQRGHFIHQRAAARRSRHRADPRGHRPGHQGPRRSSRSTARAASARASRWPT